MSQRLPIAELLLQAHQIVVNSRFLISSFPDAELVTAQHYLKRLEAVKSILSTYTDTNLLSPSDLANCITIIDGVLDPIQKFCDNPPPNPRPETSTAPSGGRGRPRVVLNLDRALELHSLGNTWDDIAQAMGCGRQTLFDHFMRAGIDFRKPAPLDISDDDLDEIMAHCAANQPFTGAIVHRGSLQSMGIDVSIKRIQASLRRVDAVGVALRLVNSSRLVTELS